MKKKPNWKFLGVGVLLLTLIFSVSQIAIANNVSSLIPDSKIVEQREHLAKIDQLYNSDEAERKTQEYLSSLGLKGILETAAEFAYEGRLQDAGFLLAPYLQQELDKSPPVSELRQVILNKSNDKVFRAFVLDGVLNSNILQGYKRPEVIDALLSMAIDKSETSYLRRTALLDLRVPNSFIKPGFNNNQSVLKTIFEDKTNPPEVRGAAITAMRRTEDPNLNLAINDTLTNYFNYPGEIIRYAAIEAAKGKTNQEFFIEKLNTIAKQTDEKAVYGSVIFSLGIIGGEQAIKAILSNYGRFDDYYTCNSALTRNYKAILSMIDLNQSKENIISGINAAKLAGITPALKPLESMVELSEDEQLVSKSQDAINYIRVNPGANNYEKWEVN